MSDSQEQSLNEDAVFLPVNESSPEFLHCEKERQAVESLINSGPEAFYASIGTERSGCFLSSEEVNQIASWAQDYRFNPQLVQSQQNGERSGPEMEGFCSTYFPHCSDTPAPNLELGWPETGPWAPQGSVTVHTNPPAEGEPSIREIIRRNLQQAGQVIAIVTDRLTDGAVIGDLHNAAFRGVPVYIILNQRSIQDNFTLNRLRHPNMQVRVLGGKSFCSRTGKMVVGEMKEKFVLVDLETVIHGSYSLTWTDTHLHRQLVTVLSGPVVESFDREFRILFAASLPVPDSWRVAGSPIDMTLQLKDHSDLLFKRQNHMETDIINPPSPPADSLLDWEAMGVIQRDCMSPGSPQYQHEDIMAMDIPLHSKMLFNRNTPIMGGFISNGNQPVDNKRLYENSSPVTNNVPDKPTALKNLMLSPTDLMTSEKTKRLYENSSPVTNNVPDKPTALKDLMLSPTDLMTSEKTKRVDHIINKAISRQRSTEKPTNLDDIKTTRLDDEPAHNMVLLSPKRREPSRAQFTVAEQASMTDTSPRVENAPSSRKPLILRMPQSESFSSLSDIMKRLQSQQSTAPARRRHQTAASELSQSMMDLSVHHKEEDRGVPVPRFKTSQSFDPDHMTPALALMKKRNDEVKPSLYRTPKNYLPRERPRNSSHALWRRSWAEPEIEHD